ncbi:MAG: phosphoribosylformylglycinamidine synthase I [Chloroflexi bacterium]|jgi:phosphoribosylformylglycinamidine synthase|nr:phosphoribosylformylglycinamidine synthase I [Chloroflexota bacterium]MDP7197260.1 phosphoribosylformylglycinamidine synthase subunit PurQ [SAR202 cluster bacterium]|tara:strand:- start:120 stop:818 length:699 start_codon:yes stop_codon:yes gene_type:complete
MQKKKFGIIIFPGTWSDKDCYYAINNILNNEARYIWHKETNVDDLDCLVLPGGFSYGDYLRPGAIARFSPIMKEIINFAKKGKPIIGICNGFQILCEAKLLPGILLPNDVLEFRCTTTYLKVQNSNSIFTNECNENDILNIPISHGEGNYFANKNTINDLEENKRILFKYSSVSGNITKSANPNGSTNNIAGIINKQGNVLGMMPHPERSCEKSLGSEDGNLIFKSIMNNII